MSERSRATRRTVLRTCGAACLGTGGTAVARGGESDSATTEPQTGEVTTVRSGLYPGTVDRIVDGEHVVVLLAEDGEEVGQKILSRDRAPRVEEGDHVHLWLWRGTVLGIWSD